MVKFEHSYTAGPWYPWVHGSRETTIEEKMYILRMHSIQYLKIIQIYLHHTSSRSEHPYLKLHGVGYIAVTKLLLYTLILLIKN
jgi:hypothetical protein